MVKRVIDVIGSAIGLVVASPVLAVLAVLVRVRLGSPVLFRHERLGLHERPFTLVKLRTMTDARDADGRLRPDAERLTALGRFLRSTSLDELPELWLVLTGEMSLVGPRPLPPAYLERYTAIERSRQQVRPGLTGWAQVNGRNALGWDDRLALDVWYVEHGSTLLDLRIIARTIGAVFRRHGITEAGNATMTELRPHLADGGDR